MFTLYLVMKCSRKNMLQRVVAGYYRFSIPKYKGKTHFFTRWKVFFNSTWPVFINSDLMQKSMQ